VAIFFRISAKMVVYSKKQGFLDDKWPSKQFCLIPQIRETIVCFYRKRVSEEGKD
jgi:hypothetical protein